MRGKTRPIAKVDLTSMTETDPYQIPEDLQYILADTSFFKDNAEITTKEILKRYGDFGKGPVPQRVATGEPTTRTTSNRGNNTPVSARIETDPSQDTATQVQSSVRHMQAPSATGYPNKQNPPQTGMELAPPQPPQPAVFRDRSASSGSQQSIGRPPQPDGQQQQIPYRPRPGPGAMGVAG